MAMTGGSTGHLRCERQPAARQWLAERELDDDNQCLLRRTVRADGRSRAYVNGTPTPLTEVRDLGERLISIHSQHEHQALMKKEAHRHLLDNFAEARELALTVRDHWRQWQKARRAHDDALNQAREQNEREELLRFQLEELDALALQEGELEQLEQEQQRFGQRGKPDPHLPAIPQCPLRRRGRHPAMITSAKSATGWTTPAIRTKA